MAEALPGSSVTAPPAPLNPELLSVQSGMRLRQPSPLPGAETNPYDVAQGAEAVPASRIEVDRATMEQTLHHNPIASLYRMTSREIRIQAGKEGAGDPLLEPDELNRRYGVEWQGKPALTFDRAMPEDVAAELRDTKVEELRRQFIQARDPGGYGVEKFAVGLLFSAIDPLNLAVGLVPVVGQARYAKMLASASGVFGRTAVRAGVGAVEGAVGTALIEPIVYAGAQSEQADYDLTDSFLNVTFGTVLGGGLHVTLGGFRGAVESRVRETKAQAAIDERMAAVVEAGVPQGRIGIAEPGMMGDLPIIAARDIELTAESVRLGTERADLAKAMSALPAGDQGAAGLLSRLAAVEQALTNPDLSRAERKAISERRDEILTNTTPEKLRAAAAPIEQRRQAENQIARIEEAQARVADELARRTSEGTIGVTLVNPAELAKVRARIVQGSMSHLVERAPIQNKETALRSAVAEMVNDGELTRTGEVAKALNLVREPDDIGVAPVREAGPSASNVVPFPTERIVATREAAGESQDARAALEEAETLVNGLDRLGGLSLTDRALLESADGKITDAQSTAKAIDIALACALRG